MSLPAKLKPAWQTGKVGRLSAPVIAEETLLVAARDSHQVVAFDAETGAEKWRHTAGGPVDSAPTIHRGTALFGAADGTVTCLRLADGEPAWRFHAAPLDRRSVARQQVESLWPVHGNVLVVDDTAYFTAGRSTYVDGGLFLYALDPATGTVKHSRRLASPHAGIQKPAGKAATESISQNKIDYKTHQGPDKSDAFSMAEGNISDILVADADADAIYLRHMKFDRAWQPRQDRTHHLFSTSRLLDENESHRSHWFFGNGDFSRLPVAYEWLTRGSYGGFESPLGKLMVIDADTCWSTFEKRDKHVLISWDIKGIDQRVPKDFPMKNTLEQKVLADSIGIHPRAMIKAGDHLLLAGFASADSGAHAYGKPIEDRGVLLQVDAKSGATAATLDLDSPPVFDGMAAANGRLYISCEDGSVACLR